MAKRLTKTRRKKYYVNRKEAEKVEHVVKYEKSTLSRTDVNFLHQRFQNVQRGVRYLEAEEMRNSRLPSRMTNSIVQES